jgi:hypothetical protein
MRTIIRSRLAGALALAVLGVTPSADAATVSTETALSPLTAVIDIDCPPRAVWTGSNYLVAWGNQSGIHAAVVSPSGAIVHTARRVAAASTSVQACSLDAAWGTTRALLVWTNHATRQISGVHVDGANVPGAVFTVSPTAGRQQANPGVAFDGSSFLVAFQDLSASSSDWSNSDIRARRIGATGAILGPELIITNAVNGQLRPAVTWGGGLWLVVWDDNRAGGVRHVFGQLVANDGSLIDPNFQISTDPLGGQRNAHTASNGTDYFVTWFDDNTDTIEGSFVDVFGTAATPGGFAVAHLASSPGGASGDVAYNATANRYLVAWRPTDGTLRGSSVLPGTSAASSFVIGSATGDAGVAASNTATSLVAYARGTGLDGRLPYARRVTLP